MNIVLSEFLSKRAPSICSRIDCVVDGHLPIVVVQPRVDILTALLQDFLAQNDGGRRCIGKEVVIRDRSIGTNSCSTIVTEMKDARLDTKPSQIPSHRDTNMSVDLLAWNCTGLKERTFSHVRAVRP